MTRRNLNPQYLNLSSERLLKLTGLPVVTLLISIMLTVVINYPTSYAANPHASATTLSQTPKPRLLLAKSYQQGINLEHYWVTVKNWMVFAPDGMENS